MLPMVARFLIINGYAFVTLCLIGFILLSGMRLEPVTFAAMAAYPIVAWLAWLAYVRTYPPRTVTFAHLLMFSVASGGAIFVQGGLLMWGSSALSGST